MIRLLPFLAVCAVPVCASFSLPKESVSAARYVSLAGSAADPREVPAAPAASASSADSAEREALLALARKGLLDSARSMALKAHAAHPDDAFLLLLLGKLSPAGRESADYFQQAIKTGGNSPEAEEALFRLGQYTYATGKYPLAIPYFRTYLRRFPRGGWKDPAAYWMGNACLALARARADKAGYLDSSEAWFAKLLERTKPGEYYRPLALEGLAKAKAGKGDRDGAWRATQEALEQAPEEEKPPLLLLAAQTRQGVDRGAERSMLMRLLADYPQSPEALYLSRLNANADTAHWKSGSGFPRAAEATLPKESSKAAGTDPSHGNTEAAGPSHATQPTTAPAAATGDKPFTLQCGAFAQPVNAQSMMASLTKLGLTPETLERERGGTRIYQVRVGRFATAEEAEAFARDHLKPQHILSQPIPVNP